MAYVLILMLAGGGSAVTTAEFASEKACTDAGEAARDAHAAVSTYKVVFVCSPKG
jgi:hypothetical protein